MANVTGTNGNDTITLALVSAGVVGIPTVGDDSISAQDGDDTVEAGGGNDFIDGGDGNDSLNRPLKNLPNPLKFRKTHNFELCVVLNIPHSNFSVIST